MVTNVSQEKRKLIFESGQTSLLIGLGVACKMAVDLVVAASFGLGAQTDAFFVAYTVPLMIEALIYPACQSGLVPIFVRQMQVEQVDHKWAFFNTFFNLGLLISVTFVMVGVAGASWIVLFVAPGADPVTYALAVRLTRVLFLSTLFVGPVGVMRAFLNAHSLFHAPALLELIRGIAVLGTITLTYRVYSIETLALGFVVGGLCQFIVLSCVIILQLGFGYRPVVKLATLNLSQTGGLFLVPLADSLLTQTILIIQRVIGSFLLPGSISAISYGHRLASVISVMLFSGVEVVSLSTLAVNFTKGTAAHLGQARDIFVAGLRLVFILGIPVAASIWVLSFPLTQLLFQRGAFDQQATQLAAPVLGIYALSIPFFGHWLLLKNYLFAAIQPAKILASSCVIVGVNVALALLLWQSLEARGVAMAYVGGLVMAYGLGFLVLDQAINPFQKGLIYLAIKVIGASLAMGAMIYMLNDRVFILLSKIQIFPGSITLLASLLLTGTVGVTVFLASLIVLQVEEAGGLLHYLREIWTLNVDYRAE